MFRFFGRNGKDGRDGIDGVDGKDGKDGRDGVDGKDGKQGIKGEKGERGEKGKDGENATSNGQVIKGEKGDKGDKGDVGLKGEKGDKGEQGIQGEKGSDGKNGLNGKDGIDGKQGKTGAKGKDGIDGKDGIVDYSLVDEKISKALIPINKKYDEMLVVLNQLKEQVGGSGGSDPTPEPQPVKALPSAYGAGAYVTGGRGGDVYHVTNLNDSGTGSLRDALSADNRMIVFDVSGIIVLNNQISMINRSNISILGQTAPEGGITIDGDLLYVENGDNLIFRHIRFKGGIQSTAYAGGPTNSFQAKLGINNQIYDHCTFAFGFFQGGSWYETNGSRTTTNLTVQRCLFAENDRGALSGTESGTGYNVGNYSFLNNAFFNVSHRTPNAGGDGARIDIINNIVWYIGNRFSQIDGGLLLNHIGNYYNYNYQPANDYRMQMLQYEGSTLPQIHTDGNHYVAENTQSPLTSTISEINSDNRLGIKFFVGQSGYSQGDQVPMNHFVGTRHTLNGEPFTPLTGLEALIDVSNNVGCNARLNADGSVSDNLDTLDAGYLYNIQNNIYTTSRRPSSEWVVPSISSVSRPVGFYGTNQHIPQAFLAAKGVANTLTVHNELAPSGYTWIEEYLNQVDK